MLVFGADPTTAQARTKTVKNNSLILNTFYRNNLRGALDYYFHLVVTLSFSKKISLTDCTMPAMSKIQILKRFTNSGKKFVKLQQYT